MHIVSILSQITGIYFIIFVCTVTISLVFIVSWSLSKLYERTNIEKNLINNYLFIIFSAIMSIIIYRIILDTTLEYVDSVNNPSHIAKSDLAQRVDEMIIDYNRPIVIDKKRKNACIVVHGLYSCPTQMKKIIDYLNKYEYDIYAPTLKWALYDLRKSNHINNQDVINNLYQDVEYVVSKKYEKVYIIAHSYGCLQTLHLSILDKLPNNWKIVLINPAFWDDLNRDFLNLGCLLFSLFLPYYQDKPYGPFDENLFDKKYMYKKDSFLFPLNMALECMKMSQSVEDRVRNKQDAVKNDFYLIDCTKDGLVDPIASKNLLTNQAKLKKILMLNNTHSVIVETKCKDFFNAINFCLGIT